MGQPLWLPPSRASTSPRRDRYAEASYRLAATRTTINDTKSRGGSKDARSMAGPRTDHRGSAFQSLDDSARGAGHPPVHRHGLWLQRVLAAALARAGRGRTAGLRAGDIGVDLPVHQSLRLAGVHAGL